MQSEISPSLRSHENLTVIPGNRGLLNASSVEILTDDPPFSHGFLDKDPQSSKDRSTYFKATIMTIIITLLYVVWGVLPIYWGSVFNLYNHVHNIEGWVVDLDGGLIGQTVSQAFLGSSGPLTQMTWIPPPSIFNISTRDEFEWMLVQEKTWAIVAINAGATDKLNQVVSSGNGPYNASLAVTVYVNEARSSNAVRSFVLPQVQSMMGKIQAQFAVQQAARLGASGLNSTSLLTAVPSVVVSPLAYTLDNVRPFDSAIVTVVNFVGLIYVTIISFVTVVTNYGTTTAGTKIYPRVSISTLVILRLSFYFASYFILSCFIALLNLAFGTPFARHFGSSGFVIYWMMAWVSMLALGLTLDAVIILVTTRFVPFFLILWIVLNVSIVAYPFEVLPGVYKYGYAMPFYNLSKTVLAICFNTKNDIGMNFGIQIAWVALNTFTISVLSYVKSKRHLRQYRKTHKIIRSEKHNASTV